MFIYSALYNMNFAVNRRFNEGEQQVVRREVKLIQTKTEMKFNQDGVERVRETISQSNV